MGHRDGSTSRVPGSSLKSCPLGTSPCSFILRWPLCWDTLARPQGSKEQAERGIYGERPSCVQGPAQGAGQSGWHLALVMCHPSGQALVPVTTYVATAPWQTTPDMNQPTQPSPLFSVSSLPGCPLWLFSVPLSDVYNPKALSPVPPARSFVIHSAECWKIFSWHPSTFSISFPIFSSFCCP